MLLGRNLRLHLVFGGLALLMVIVGFAWHAIESQRLGRIVGGSSVVGLVLGSLAAAIIFFELGLWPRKRMRRYKLGPARYWLAAHLWFGLATGPLAFVHAGYRFGGTFTSCLMWLLVFVLASGIYGWIMQVVIPRWMLGNLPDETIHGQIQDVSIQNAIEARRLLTVAFGPKPDGLTKLTNLDGPSSRLQGERTLRDSTTKQYEKIVVGAPQRRSLVRTRSQISNSLEIDPADSRTVWKEYSAVIDPFLIHGLSGVQTTGQKTEIAKLRNRQKSIEYFSLLRQSCHPSCETVIEQLEKLCAQRHQLDAQKSAQRWLHSWIAVHAGASILLGLLLVTHIVLALRYM